MEPILLTFLVYSAIWVGAIVFAIAWFIRRRKVEVIATRHPWAGVSTGFGYLIWTLSMIGERLLEPGWPCWLQRVITLFCVAVIGTSILWRCVRLLIAHETTQHLAAVNRADRAEDEHMQNTHVPETTSRQPILAASLRPSKLVRRASTFASPRFGERERIAHACTLKSNAHLGLLLFCVPLATCVAALFLLAQLSGRRDVLLAASFQMCPDLLLDSVTSVIIAFYTLGVGVTYSRVVSYNDSLYLGREFGGVCFSAVFFGGIWTIAMIDPGAWQYEFFILVTSSTIGMIPIGVPLWLSYIYTRGDSAAEPPNFADTDSNHSRRVGAAKVYGQALDLVTPSEISTFDGMIHSRLGHAAFEKHLATEFSIENLMFWDEVGRFRRRFTHTIAAREEDRGEGWRRDLEFAARRIYNKFIPMHAPHVVNLASHVAQPLHAIFSSSLPADRALGSPHAPAAHSSSAASPRPEVKSGVWMQPPGAAADGRLIALTEATFDAARAEIARLMGQDSYRRFQKSKLYAQFIAEHGKLGAPADVDVHRPDAVMSIATAMATAARS